MNNEWKDDDTENRSENLKEKYDKLPMISY